MAQPLSPDIVNHALRGNLGSQAGPTTLQTFIGQLIQIGLISGIVIFFFMLLTGGVQYLTAGGDKEGVQKAAKRIFHSLVGIVLLFSVFAITTLVSSLFGINLLSFNIPTL